MRKGNPPPPRQSRVWPRSVFLCCDCCHKKLIELSAQGVKGQTHPVRSRLVASNREGLGGCDLLIGRDMLDWEGGGGGGLRRAAPVNYEENQWRQEVIRGGWSILSWRSSSKRKKNWRGGLKRRKREERYVRQGGRSSKTISVQRHHSALFENTSVEVKNKKSTMRYLAQSCSHYVTNSNSWNASDHFWKRKTLDVFMHVSWFFLFWFWFFFFFFTTSANKTSGARSNRPRRLSAMTPCFL